MTGPDILVPGIGIFRVRTGKLSSLVTPLKTGAVRLDSVLLMITYTM